jgi:hypothetical protein
VLVYWYHQSTPSPGDSRSRAALRISRFVGLLWLLAYVEELVWDRGVWHQRSWLFGPAWDLQSLDVYLVPLLAVPQITHYVLDGFIWRRRTSRRFATLASPKPA